MADEVGLDKVTLAALAERLGVRQPSLYKHMDSLAGLHRSVAIQSKRELGEGAIHAMSHAYRNWALAHPGRYVASNAMPEAGDVENEAVSLEVVQIVADVLTSYTLAGDDAIDAIRAFRSTLHGFVSYEASGGFALSADIDRSFERLVNGFIIALMHWTEVVDATSPGASD